MAQIIHEEEFIHPIDLDLDSAIGVMLPFNNKKGGLFTLSYTTEKQAISNLKNLLLTKKGERPFLPFFGSDIAELLFEQSDLDLVDRLKSSIKRDVGFWMPEIKIQDILIEQDIDRYTVTIQIKFSVTPSKQINSLTLAATSSGALTIT